MPRTLVLQSCPQAEADGWLGTCMRSVRQWADGRGLAYRWLDDELFSVLPAALREDARITAVIASDLARLEWARRLLAEPGTERLLWLDADVLVIDAEALQLPDADYAVGREVWVQAAPGGGWRSYRKVHNAALYFRADPAGRNSFLDFYADSARRLLLANSGSMPPQFIGPKLLTALHNVVQLPVIENVGMISPALAEALLGGNDGPLACYRRRATVPLAAANLCRSSLGRGERSAAQMSQLIRCLQAAPAI